KYPSIDVMRITAIANSRNPISSPAPSLRRLEISYRYKKGNASDNVLISPKDEAGFISHLKSINENIEVAEGVKPFSKGTKLMLCVCAGILAVTVIGVGALFLIGEREPVVTISDRSMSISAMYGTSVALENIADVTLLNQSMREIGAGMRTNGYNGGAWRGHFRAGLLFVRPDSAPTIHIELVLGNDIFISFRESERTQMLYEELAALVPVFKIFYCY
ncbi:MAG: PH domain-containing protein, partial [Oscillospiraceae bacterium]|nr:PH domain-containing protein [Oscillospiraceae bacterium]